MRWIELTPEERLKALYDYLKYVSENIDLPAREIRKKYAEERDVAPSLPRVCEDLLRGADFLYLIPKGFPPRYYYEISPEGARILRKGYLELEDIPEFPDWVRRSILRKPRKVKWYKIRAVVASKYKEKPSPITGKIRSIEAHLELEVDELFLRRKNIRLGREVYEDALTLLKDVLGRVIIDILRNEGYSEGMWEIKGIQKVEEIEEPTGSGYFEVVDQDLDYIPLKAEFTTLKYWFAPVRKIYSRIYLDITNNLERYFVGKSGRSGRPKGGERSKPLGEF